jgi:cytochrome c peroxidase
MVELGLAAKVDATQREAIVAYLAEIAVNPAIADYVPCGTEEEGVTKADLGSRLFFDKSLSLRGNTSCSSCHNPSRGFADGRFHDVGDANPVSGALSVGDDNVSLGGRNAPTAAYAMFSPAFSQLPDGNYSGGQFHDGRAATLKDQAKGPFLDGAEMMMPDAASVVTRVVAKSDYVADFKALYGEDVFDDTDVAYDAVAEAITAFEKTDVFAPFDSKYDRSKLDPGDADYYAMSAQEATGYALFFSETMHCNRCHTINSTSEKATGELFTNYRYENIGRPKNLEALLARDGNTDRIDLGLGGRSDINDSRHYGKTKVPTLRNIAVTGPYMNNGVFKQLRTVLEFYDHMAGEGGHPLNPRPSITPPCTTPSHSAIRRLTRWKYF